MQIPPAPYLPVEYGEDIVLSQKTKAWGCGAGCHRHLVRVMRKQALRCATIASRAFVDSQGGHYGPLPPLDFQFPFEMLEQNHAQLRADVFKSEEG